MSKTVLVTGGFGFIGSHLIETLLQDQDTNVHVVDNLSSNPLPLDYLFKEIGEQPRLSCSICSVQEFCKNPQVDFSEIYHLASVVGPAGVLRHSGKIIKMIVNDIYSLIDLALKRGVRLLDISTSEVYGGGQEGFCSETMSKIIPPTYSPRLEYAVGKLATEVALINTTKVSSLQVVIIRPFNVSGPRQSGVGGFVLPRFIARALENQDLTVFGDGNQIRAFTNVKDIVNGIILAMHKGKTGEIYNLGNPNNRCTINELADAVIRITGSKGGKRYLDPKTIYGPLYEEANNKFPDAGKAISELGWQPIYSRDETIEQTVNYFRQLPSAVREHLSGRVENSVKSSL